MAKPYGYSAEEGMDAIKQALQQGLSGSDVKKLFEYERSTGADRGALSSLAFMSERYGAGDALKSSWAGLHASGMNTGQYSEYLRAMQRSIEDGISKGFVKSSEDVAQNLTMLSALTGGNELWKGEHGARRLSEMQAGVAGATGLNSADDIMVFRAMQMTKPKKNWVDTLADMQEGKIDADFLRNYYNLISSAEGKDYNNTVMRMANSLFDGNVTLARTLHQGLSTGVSNAELERRAEAGRNVALPSFRSSEEFRMTEAAMDIRNATINAGQVFWTDLMPEAHQRSRDALANARRGDSADISRLSPEEGLAVRQLELKEASMGMGAGGGLVGGLNAHQLGQAHINFVEAERALAASVSNSSNESNGDTRLITALNSSMNRLEGRIVALTDVTRENGDVNITFQE